MRMIILIITLLSFSALSSEFAIDTNFTKLEHEWRGISVADYSADLKGVGLTYWHDSDFGVRIAHSFGNKMYTEGRYASYVIDLKGITSLELLYRYELLNDFYLIGGVSTNKIHVPITSIEENYYRNDSDDDWGWGAGFQYKFSDRISAGYRFDQRSEIKKNGNGEWTRGHSLNIAYTF